MDSIEMNKNDCKDVTKPKISILKNKTNSTLKNIITNTKTFNAPYSQNNKHPNHSTDTSKFVLIFDKTTGSDKVSYLMINPRQLDQILPKVNVLSFKRLHYLTGFKAITVGNTVYVIGGRDWRSGALSNAMMSYDPDTNAWVDCCSLNVARCRCSADVINGSCIIITGGEVSGRRVTDTVECYDPHTDHWTLLQSMPLPRVSHATCVMNDTLYVSGGVSKLQEECSAIFWVYSMTSCTWCEPIPGMSMPKECEKHVMIVIEGHKLLLMGGRSFDEDTFRERDESRVLSYDSTVTVNTRRHPCWCKLYPSMFHARSNASPVRLGDCTYIIGGHNFSKDQDVLTIEAYHMTRRRWCEAFTLPSDGNYGNVDCCVIDVPRTNPDFSFIASYIHDPWIMW